MKISPYWTLLFGTLLVVAALYNHYLGHSALLVEIVLVGIGTGTALYSLRLLEKGEPEEFSGMLFQILSRYLSRKQSATLVPLIGFAMILSWTVWKLFVIGTSDLRMTDFIVTLLGLSLILYYYGPSRFAMQKDFVVLYLTFLTVTFVVIWGAYTRITGESYYRVTAYSEYYFITIPVVALINLCGVSASAELDLGGIGLSNVISYEYHGVLLRVGIGTGCSGLYSAGLFFSAFLAFVLVRYGKVDLPIVLSLGLGLFITWAGNIVRMTITVLVGHAYGHPALAFVHSYIGILIFVVFITAFWFLVVRWLDKREFKEVGEEPGQEPVTPEQTTQ